MTRAPEWHGSPRLDAGFMIEAAKLSSDPNQRRARCYAGWVQVVGAVVVVVVVIAGTAAAG